MKYMTYRLMIMLGGLVTTFDLLPARQLMRKITLPAPALATQCDLTLELPQQATQCPAITIWIHGSRLFPREIFKSFFQNTPQLKPALELSSSNQLRKVANALIESDPSEFCAETFYLFGWSGKISFKAREEAALLLYQDLKKICADYKKRYGVLPFIRIIAHSHGGNVALNMAQLTESNDTIKIAELILLACPVQIKTMDYIKSPLFNRIYALYSSLDFMQILDPQGLYRDGVNTPLFSQRKFPTHEKLLQVKLKVNNRAITHGEFVVPHFLGHLPGIIQEMNNWYQEMPTSELPEKQKTRLLCVSIKK